MQHHKAELQNRNTKGPRLSFVFVFLCNKIIIKIHRFSRIIKNTQVLCAVYYSQRLPPPGLYNKLIENVLFQVTIYYTLVGAVSTCFSFITQLICYIFHTYLQVIWGYCF